MAARRVVAFVCVALSAAASDAQQRQRGTPPSPAKGIKVGTFGAETARRFLTADGLPSNNVLGIAVTSDGRAFVGTDSGAAIFADGHFEQVSDYTGPVQAVAADGAAIVGASDTGLYRAANDDIEQLADLPIVGGKPVMVRSIATGKRTLLATNAGLFELKGSSLAPVDELNSQLGATGDVRQVAAAADGRIAVAAAGGLFQTDGSTGWQKLFPAGGGRSWAPRDVRGVAYDTSGRLWFCEPQGVGVQETTGWKLLTGADGLPYADFSTAAAGRDGTILFGTHDGAIRYDGKTWEYRRAPRWLPNGDIRAIAVAADGQEWYATAGGAGTIQHVPMTLAEKAKFFEDEIDKYHRRTPYEYVLDVHLAKPNDKSQWTQHDSDNDGLWTAMYGSGECFAYAATKDPLARQRATKAFLALKFLSDVTQGGDHPAPHGFPARSILPTSGYDPNAEHYTPERDRQEQQRDPLWKVISPRWPKSADGQWYWKCDTSSDELDGHFFLYALYYDLVAETEEEKQTARDVVTRIVDHLLDHGYNLVDHDGKPTRWGRFSPEEFNHDLRWAEGRGLNSMCMLSYLKVAEHVSGDAKYRRAYDDLVQKHSYALNSMVPKVQYGYGTGNQSDDEMAFMSFYNLIRYEDDPELKRYYVFAFYRYWRTEAPELNPLFNFLFAATTQDAFPDGAARGRFRTGTVPQEAIDEGVDTLIRYPLDRVHWPFKNSHRLDIVRMSQFPGERSQNGHRLNGKVVPVDERSVGHWNHNPWQLDEEGHNGQTLTDGAAFLLPYYLGVYRKYILD